MAIRTIFKPVDDTDDTRNGTHDVLDDVVQASRLDLTEQDNGAILYYRCYRLRLDRQRAPQHAFDNLALDRRVFSHEGVGFKKSVTQPPCTLRAVRRDAPFC